MARLTVLRCVLPTVTACSSSEWHSFSFFFFFACIEIQVSEEGLENYLCVIVAWKWFIGANRLKIRKIHYVLCLRTLCIEWLRKILHIFFIGLYILFYNCVRIPSSSVKFNTLRINEIICQGYNSILQPLYILISLHLISLSHCNIYEIQLSTKYWKQCIRRM